MWEDVKDALFKTDKTDEDIERLLPWFYENVKCVNQVKEGLLVLQLVKDFSSVR